MERRKNWSRDWSRLDWTLSWWSFTWSICHSLSLSLRFFNRNGSSSFYTIDNKNLENLWIPLILVYPGKELYVYIDKRGQCDHCMYSALQCIRKAARESRISYSGHFILADGWPDARIEMSTAAGTAITCSALILFPRWTFRYSLCREIHELTRSRLLVDVAVLY